MERERNICRSLYLGYFKKILDENEELKEERWICTFSPNSLCNYWISNICHKVISAPTEEKALEKFILSDDGLLLDLFYRFKWNYCDDETEQFPEGETTYYYNQLVDVKLLPKKKGGWGEEECIMKDDFNMYDKEDIKRYENEFVKPYHDFLTKNIETLVQYFKNWSNDGREFRIYNVCENTYIW